MKADAVKKFYNFCAPLYDLYFGAYMKNGLRKVIGALRLSGGEKILEVGVGTGLSLDHYPATASVTGIDFSERMLMRARSRVDRKGMRNVKLSLIDAEAMAYSESSFDYVIIMYVLSVTPNPEKLIDKALKVCKDGGVVVIVNRFSRSKLLARLANTGHLDRIESKIGFSLHFPIDKYIGFLNSRGYHQINVESANYGLSKIVRIKKTALNGTAAVEGVLENDMSLHSDRVS